MTYKELKLRHETEFNKFPLHFALGQEQLNVKIKELGFKDEKELYENTVGLGIGGGFILRKDVKAYNDMCNRHYEEMQDQIHADIDGTGFIKSMFAFELANHEYSYTGDLSEILMACGITYKDLEENENLRKGLELAIAEYKENEEELE